MTTTIATLILPCLLAGVESAPVPPHVEVADIGAGATARAELEQELGAYGFLSESDGSGAASDFFIDLRAEGTTLTRGADAPIEFPLDFSVATRLQRRRHFIMIVERMRSLSSRPEPSTRDSAAVPESVSAIAGVSQGASSAPVVATDVAVRLSAHRTHELGLATAVSYMGDDLGVTTHAALHAQWFAGRYLGLVGRLLWPLQESTRLTPDQITRSWTFGVDVGTSLTLDRTANGVRPYFSLGVGPRFLLLDGTRVLVPQHEVAVRFGWNASLAVGIRARLWSRTIAFAQAEFAYTGTFRQRGMFFEPVRAMSGAGAIASLGVLFDR